MLDRLTGFNIIDSVEICGRERGLSCIMNFEMGMCLLDMNS